MGNSEHNLSTALRGSERWCTLGAQLACKRSRRCNHVSLHATCKESLLLSSTQAARHGSLLQLRLLRLAHGSDILYVVIRQLLHLHTKDSFVKVAQNAEFSSVCFTMR
jgi:hypothetical protein